MSKWKRRLCWLGGFVVLAGVYVWLFGVQTFFGLIARRAGRKVPIVNSVPVDLQDLSVSNPQAKNSLTWEPTSRFPGTTWTARRPASWGIGSFSPSAPALP
jgi:hypothetical protein